LPAAVAVGRFADGTSIGQGWNQPTAAVQTWLGVGVAVDTATLLAVATLLVLALPSRPTAAVAPTLFRASPAAVVLVGWWLTRHPVADASDRVWLAQAVVWVVVVALLAASSLPMGFRLIAIAGVMPLLSFTILNDLVGSDGRGFDGVRYLHHLAVAIGVTAYVVAVPKLLRRLRAQPVLAPSAR
jgi:hypothetical protein